VDIFVFLPRKWLDAALVRPRKMYLLGSKRRGNSLYYMYCGDKVSLPKLGVERMGGKGESNDGASFCKRDSELRQREAQARSPGNAPYGYNGCLARLRPRPGMVKVSKTSVSNA
jgi:hypothetical protein